ncbi:MAG TPA: hypothetical protein VLS28_08925 [Candidatus Sulfomarinibacteraceae bacterium]|nr:hypothetical protein [Candidatus Sulfomarinibacteraceae bacterium]
MRLISILLRSVLVASIVAGLAAAIAALIAKGRMVSSGGPEDDELDLVAIYDGMEFASRAPALRRAAVTAWYGGGTLDLREATLDPAGAVLTVRAIFGGFELVIPETWRVELRARGIFGGIGDARKLDRIEPTGPLLTIEGFAVFGGVGIVSRAPVPEETAATATVTLPADAVPVMA